MASSFDNVGYIIFTVDASRPNQSVIFQGCVVSNPETIDHLRAVIAKQKIHGKTICFRSNNECNKGEGLGGR